MSKKQTLQNHQHQHHHLFSPDSVLMIVGNTKHQTLVKKKKQINPIQNYSTLNATILILNFYIQIFFFFFFFADPNEFDSLDGWVPDIRLVLTLFLCISVLSSITNIIDDCDEVYNYWEPTHFMMNGFGFQTWEYSPEYGLRSYLYLYIHLIFGKISSLFLKIFFLNENKVQVFMFMRAFIGAFAAISQTIFWFGVTQRFGSTVSRYLLLFLAGSAGMFISITSKFYLLFYFYYSFYLFLFIIFLFFIYSFIYF